MSRDIAGRVRGRRFAAAGLGAGAALLLLGAGAGRAMALDPRQPDYHFQFSLYPPGGFSAKKSVAVPRPDPKKPKAYAIVGKDGRFADFAQWYYAIGSDPACFRAWWLGYFTDTNIWHECRSPVFRGTAPINQGHRIIAWLGTLKKLVDADPEIDPAVKQTLMNDAWKRAAEEVIAGTINAQGMLEYGGNKADMACLFHFMRTKWGALGLDIPRFYTLERAQNLVCTMLTEPWVICEEDRYVDPPDRDYLEDHIGRQYAGVDSDIRIVKDGRILYTGGLFIGWKQQPSLHGTWDGLTIFNSLFKYYPDPDPASPKSIFHKWNRLPEEKKQIGKKCILLMERRLWLDWKEKQGPTWCWVRDGKPSDDASRPSEALFQPAYDGYNDNQLGWAKLCWEEMFGDPSRNTNDGVQSLLAIAKGRVHRELKTPHDQQVPGRFDFDRAAVESHLAEDAIRFATPKERPVKESGEK